MKKRIFYIINFIIMLVLLFILTGCTDKKEEKNMITNNFIETENQMNESEIIENEISENSENLSDVNNNIEKNSVSENNGKNNNKNNFSEIIKYSEMNNLPYDKKVPDSKLDYLVVYDGFPIKNWFSRIK